MDLNEPGLPSNGKLKITNGAVKSSKSIGRKSPVTTTLPQSTGETSQESTLSAAGSLASRFPLPGSDQARTMTVTSGRKWSAALTLSGRLGSLARTCLGSSHWHSTKCVLTWKISVTPSGRSVFRLVPSMPRTNGNGSGLWPTASAGKITESGELVNADGKPWDGNGKPHSKTSGKPVQTALTDAVKMWPTPNARDHKDTGENVDWEKVAKKSKLAGAVMWPTPSVCGNYNRKGSSKTSGDGLATKVGKDSQENGSLNPNWVEWLMGYPVGWTDLGDSATPSSRKSSKRSGG